MLGFHCRFNPTYDSLGSDLLAATLRDRSHQIKVDWEKISVHFSGLYLLAGGLNLRAGKGENSLVVIRLIGSQIF